MEDIVAIAAATIPSGRAAEVPYSMEITRRGKDNTVVYDSKRHQGLTYVFNLKRSNKDGSVVYRCRACSRMQKLVSNRKIACTPELRPTSFKSLDGRWELDPDYQPHFCTLSPLEQGAILRKACRNRLLEPELSGTDYSKQIQELDTKEMTFVACIAYYDRLRLPTLTKLNTSETKHFLDDPPSGTETSTSTAFGSKRTAHFISQTSKRYDKFARPNAQAHCTSHTITNGLNHSHSHNFPSSLNSASSDPSESDLRKSQMELLVLKKQVCEKQLQSAKRVQDAADAILQIVPQLNGGGGLNLINNNQHPVNLYNMLHPTQRL